MGEYLTISLNIFSNFLFKLIVFYTIFYLFYEMDLKKWKKQKLRRLKVYDCW